MHKAQIQQFQEWLSRLEEPGFSSRPLTLVAVDEKTLVALSSLACRWVLDYIHHSKGHLCLFLIGPLGAGKTRFSQAFIGQFMQNAVLEVESPTYAYVIPYENQEGIELQHFDLYRLKSPEHLFELGLEEKWQAPGISLIEWPACSDSLAPYPRLQLTIAYESPHTRNLSWEWSLTPPIPTGTEV